MADNGLPFPVAGTTWTVGESSCSHSLFISDVLNLRRNKLWLNGRIFVVLPW